MRLAPKVKREIAEADTLIFEEGQRGRQMYLILTGKVEIYRGEGQSREVLAELSKNEFFGEMALIDAEPRIASARALQTTTLLTISEQEFDRRLKTADPFVRAVLRVLTKMVRDLSPKKA